MSGKATVLLEHHLRELKLPTFLREYGKVAGVCAAEGVDHPGYLLRLAELELIDRHHRMVDRRIRAARFPATKSLDTFDFLGHAVGEQAPGHAAGPLRVRRPARERHRSRQQRHRQDPCRPRPGTGRLPEGAVGRLHHRRVAGTRADRGQGRGGACSTSRRSWPGSSCSSSTSLASYRCPGREQSCSSRSSASATSEGPSWSRPTCPSTSGRRSWARRG